MAGVDILTMRNENEKVFLILTSKNVHENFNARLHKIDVVGGKWGENENDFLILISYYLRMRMRI